MTHETVDFWSGLREVPKGQAAIVCLTRCNVKWSGNKPRSIAWTLNGTSHWYHDITFARVSGMVFDWLLATILCWYSRPINVIQQLTRSNVRPATLVRFKVTVALVMGRCLWGACWVVKHYKINVNSPNDYFTLNYYLGTIRD